MSCSVWSLQANVLAAGFAAYSCGPNVVVGAGGTVVTGAMTIKDKVYKFMLQSQLKLPNLTEAQRKILVAKLQEIERNEVANFRLCSKFAVSMIPFVGPAQALLTADNKPK